MYSHKHGGYHVNRDVFYCVYETARQRPNLEQDVGDNVIQTEGAQSIFVALWRTTWIVSASSLHSVHGTITEIS